MRKLIILSTALLIASCGTFTKVSGGEGFLKEDHVINTRSKNENYILANEWMVEAFTNSKSVIHFSDKEAGIVKGKYLLYNGNPSTYYGSDDVYAIITLRVKDNGVKIELDTRGAKFTIWKGTGIYAGGPADGQGYSARSATIAKEALITSFKSRLQD